MTVFVPHYAMSAGTLVALAADEIVVDENAVLGPLDPQSGHAPAASVLRVLDQKKPEDIEDDTLIRADVARKAIAQVRTAARDLLGRRLPADKADVPAEKLSTGTWTHDYPIGVEEARAMGLPVTTDMPLPYRDGLGASGQDSRGRRG